MLEKLPRLSIWLVFSVALMAWLGFIQPQQLQVVLYKALLVFSAAVIGYWIDRSLFSYSRPHIYLTPGSCILFKPNQQLVFAAAMIRRALIIVAVILGMALGL